jgi:hypothetical protein
MKTVKTMVGGYIMKHVNIVILFFFLIVHITASYAASSTLDHTIFDLSVKIIEEFNRIHLQNRDIAIMGFHDADTEKSCGQLSSAIANQLESDLHKVQRLTDVTFNIIPRHSLGSIETEYLISKGGSETDILDKIKRANLLITGMWQNMETYIKLTVNVVEMKDSEIYQLFSISDSIEKTSLPVTILDCWEDQSLRAHSDDKDGTGREILSGGEIDWARKTISVKGFGAANQKFPKSVWRKSAEEAAIIDAQTKLLEFVDGLKINSKTFVENYQIVADEKIKEIKGRLKGALKVGKTSYPTEDTAEVILKLDFY